MKFITLMIRYFIVFDFQCNLQFELTISVIDSDIEVIEVSVYIKINRKLI